MNDENTAILNTIQKGLQKVSEQSQQVEKVAGSLSNAGERNRTASQIQGAHAQR